MDNFIYQYPIKQYFGAGCAEEAIKTELKKVGENVLLAYGGGSLKRTGLYDKLRTWLEASDKNVTDFGGIMPNPTYAKVQEGAQLVRENNIDFILAVGGGSVIDCCKIVSAQALLDEDIWDMWYVGHRLPTEFISMGAVVTASGTGAEQNNGAVITHEEKKLKQPPTFRCVPLFRRVGQRSDENRAHETGNQRCIRYPFALYGDLYGQTAGNESLG